MAKCHFSWGVIKVPLSKEVLTSMASARSRYCVHLDQERRKQESDAQGQKRKATEELKRKGEPSKRFLKVQSHRPVCRRSRGQGRQSEGPAHNKL